MNKTGLIITTNRFNNYFESKTYPIICDSIESAKNELINTLVKEFKNLKIDFPDDLNDFEHVVFNEQYVKSNAFTYKVFDNNTWSEPWEPNEIYTDVLDKMLEEENKEQVDFDKLYKDEEQEDETMEDTTNEDKFYEELKEKAKVFEKEVEDCNCLKCHPSSQEEN